MGDTSLTGENVLVRLVGQARWPTHWLLAPLIASIILGGVAQFTAPFGLARPSLGVPVLDSLMDGLVPFLTPTVMAPLVGALRTASASLYEQFLIPVYMIGAFAMVAIFVVLWVRLVEWRPVRTIGFIAPDAPLSALLGLLLAILFTTIIMVGLFATWLLTPREAAPGTVGAEALGAVAFMAFAYIVQGSAEEILYRGWLMNVLAHRLGVAAGVVVNVLLFACAHSRNSGFGILPGMNLVLFGLFLSLLTLRTGSLWAACLWHAFWNWSIAHVWGAAISGEPPDGGSLMAWDTVGPAVWTGGVWGPEGGLPATIILTLGTAWLFLWGGWTPGQSQASAEYGDIVLPARRR